MKVVCKVKECYYRSSAGFCLHNILFVTPQGLCGWIFNDQGLMKVDWNKPLQQQEREEERIKEITDESNE